jgi:hypothetical protein
MSMIDVVLNNPVVFGFHENIESEQEAIKIICNAKSQGSTLQKASFILIENHQAVLKLLKLGMRTPAIKLAKDLLHNAEWNQHYEIAMSVANILERNAYLTQNIEEVELYKSLHRDYLDLFQLEYQGHAIYGEMLYNYERGLPLDHKDIIANLEVIKRKTKGASCISDYYYYQCLLMINQYNHDVYERICQKAIEYFEGLYLKHTTLISIFLSKLINCYISSSKFIETEALINVHLDKTTPGSTPWNKLMHSKIISYAGQNDYVRALLCCDEVIAQERFASLADIDKLEWTKMKKNLAEELVAVR